VRVLVVHSELGVLRGGGENLTRNLFPAFAERGHEVSAAFVADCDGRYPILLPAKIRPIPLAGYWSRKLGQETLSHVARWIPQGTRLRAQWDRLQEAVCWRTIRWHDRRFTRRMEHEFNGRWKDYDVVYVHGSAILASKVAQHRPTVLFLPGPVTEDLAPVLRASHAVCAHDDALVRIREFLGDHAKELKLGLNCQLFASGPSSIRTALGWRQDDRIVGYVGRLAHIKGVDLLAAAFSEIAQTVPDVKLVIVGSGEEEKRLRAVLSKALAAGMVHIEPNLPHEKLVEWYRAMDLFVMPSRYETMSSAILEAQACGVPFLASDIAGNRMIEKAGGGWLFQHGCANSLRTCLKRILENPDAMKLRGIKGATHVKQNYNWHSSAERLESIFRSCMNMKGGARCSP
jgi:glycosyltransferase involved in cell wall biosynthesis